MSLRAPRSGRLVALCLGLALTTHLAACSDDDDDVPAGGADAGADAGSTADAAVVAPDDIPAAIPTGAAWIAHLEDDILPLYTSPAALGTPVGNFPTWRCRDGAVATLAAPCEFAAHQDWWIKDAWLGQREYVRTRARQTYLYGVAYHLTGDEQLLAYHLAGVRWLREKGLDPAGGAYSYYDPTMTTPGPEAKYRSAQDQAYAVLALAMNYYLTRDPAALADLVRLQRFIYDTYWDDALGTVAWKLAVDAEDPTRLVNPGDPNPDNRDHDRPFQLVALLDQLNAYLLLPLPMLPEGEDRERWEADVRRTVNALISKHHSPVYRLFWGEYSSADDRVVGGEHTDFGHTAKSFWLVHLAGALLGDPAWVEFGRQGMAVTLERAYITADTVFPDYTWGYEYDRAVYYGAWAGQFTGKDMLPSGSEPREIYPGNQWWIDAELDQAAATMALRDAAPGRYLGYLATTYPKWFELRVDPDHPGIYHYAEYCWTGGPYCSPPGTDLRWGKGNLWKGGFHEAEHALVGYITSQALRGEPVKLYFALADNKVNDVVTPYLFAGTVAGRASSAFADAALAGLQKVEATFTGVE